LDRYGNTSTASIPIAVVEGVEQGKIKIGDKLVFVGFGAGLTWGSAAVSWTGSLPVDHKINPNTERRLGQFRSFLRRSLRHIESLFDRE